MSFIAEFSFISPLLREALKAVPDIVLYSEDIHLSPHGGPDQVFWATGDDFATFNSALTADPTVSKFSCLIQLPRRRLYRVTYTNEENRQIMYSVASDLDIVYLDISASHEGTRICARIPNRTALKSYRDICENRGMSFKLDRIYEEEHLSEDSDDLAYGTTEAQQVALVTALERGYFAIPRETRLEDIATELDISTQALSTRLRRGQTNLIGYVLNKTPIKR